MTKPGNLHLIERAAQRLREADDHVAAQLLRQQSPAPAPAPESAQTPALVPGPIPNLAATPAIAPAPPLPPEPAPPAPSIDPLTLKQAGMIDWGSSRDRLSEEFRIIQGQVLQAMASSTAKAPAMANLLMLTSARPGEGKTFSSLNLAGSLASCSPQKVILVDVDTKRHTLTTRLGLEGKPGLLDLATDTTLRMTDLFVTTPLPNLRVLPNGSAALQESLSGGTSIIDVIERLSRAFPDTLILLDTPPCLSSSDPSTLAPLVAQVVMLVEAQQTQRPEVEAALDLVEACPAVVLLLNKVQLTGKDTFGAYGY